MNELKDPKWLASQIGLRYVASEIEGALELHLKNKIPARDLFVSLFTGEYERRKAEGAEKENTNSRLLQPPLS